MFRLGGLAGYGLEDTADGVSAFRVGRYPEAWCTGNSRDWVCTFLQAVETRRIEMNPGTCSALPDRTRQFEKCE